MKSLFVWLITRLILLFVLVIACVVGISYYLSLEFEEVYQLTYQGLIKRDQVALKKTFNQTLESHHYFGDKFPFEIHPKR